MVAIRTCVFVSASTEQLLSKNISIKVLVKSSTIRFMFIILLRRACLPMLHMRQWDLVRRVSTLQLQIGFIISCKLCLTLSSRKLLKSTQSCYELDSTMIFTTKNNF